MQHLFVAQRLLSRGVPSSTVSHQTRSYHTGWLRRSRRGGRAKLRLHGLGCRCPGRLASSSSERAQLAAPPPLPAPLQTHPASPTASFPYVSYHAPSEVDFQAHRRASALHIDAAAPTRSVYRACAHYYTILVVYICTHCPAVSVTSNVLDDLTALLEYISYNS